MNRYVNGKGSYHSDSKPAAFRRVESARQPWRERGGNGVKPRETERGRPRRDGLGHGSETILSAFVFIGCSSKSLKYPSKSKLERRDKNRPVRFDGVSLDRLSMVRI